MNKAQQRLRNDRRAVSAVEFGLLAPVLCLALMGTGDLLHRIYMQDVIDGEIQQLGRLSSLEASGGKLKTLDENVRRQIYRVAPAATVVTKRDTYSTFLAMKPERFDDLNSNGLRDVGECFEDVNGNRAWDAKPSREGQGGANDVTVLRVTVEVPRLFPMASMLGWSSSQKLISETFLKNQPFAAQAIIKTETICT